MIQQFLPELTQVPRDRNNRVLGLGNGGDHGYGFCGDGDGTGSGNYWGSSGHVITYTALGTRFEHGMRYGGGTGAGFYWDQQPLMLKVEE